MIRRILVLSVLIASGSAYVVSLYGQSDNSGLVLKLDGDDAFHVDIVAELSTDTVGIHDTVIFTVYGRLSPGYHIYSIKPTAQDGPEPTQLHFTNNPLIKKSEVTESPTEPIYDDVFETDINAHKNQFWLSQAFLVPVSIQSGQHDITGYLSYQVCGQNICSLQIKKYFSVALHAR